MGIVTLLVVVVLFFSIFIIPIKFFPWLSLKVENESSTLVQAMKAEGFRIHIHNLANDKIMMWSKVSNTFIVYRAKVPNRVYYDGQTEKEAIAALLEH